MATSITLPVRGLLQRFQWVDYRARRRRTLETLARNRLTHPLFDTDRFRRAIETAYARMWQMWLAGEEPRAFSV